MKILEKGQWLLMPLLALMLTHCTNKNDGGISLSSQKNKSSLNTSFSSKKANRKALEQSSSEKEVRRRGKPQKAVGFEYGPNIFENYDILDDIDHIAQGDVSTPTMMLTLFQTANNFEVGYKLCLAANRHNDDSCYYSLGYKNLGYGLCLAAGRNQDECMHALGDINTGFGMCMSNPLNSFNDCEISIGATNIGFGLCMAQNIQNGYYDPSDCYEALSHNNYSDNTGYGICIAAGFGYNTCKESLGDLNTGYGLCMASMNSDYPTAASENCYQALSNHHSSENIGFGLCMAGNDYLNTFNICEPALGQENIGFGLCSTAVRDNYDFWGNYNCDVALNDATQNIGYGICMASGRAAKHCDDLVGFSNDSIGAGICLSNLNTNDDDCDAAINKKATGFGLCMAAGHSYSSCSPSLHADNTGFGICSMHRDPSACSDGLNSSEEGGLDSNIGYGICMSTTSNSPYDCSAATTGGANIGFGVCMKIYKDYGRCFKTLDYDNVGYAACIADPDSSNNGSYTGDINIEGTCYEYSSENPKAQFMITQGANTSEISNKKISRNDFTQIDLDFNVPSEHQNKQADLFVVVRYKDYSGRETWYQKNGNNWNQWDGSFQGLYPDHANYTLKSSTDIIPIYNGSLADLPGYFRFYWGYRLSGEPIDAVNYNAFKKYDLQVN